MRVSLLKEIDYAKERSTTHFLGGKPYASIHFLSTFDSEKFHEGKIPLITLQDFVGQADVCLARENL